jgi:predicted O-methyltransferase YrrM
MRVYDWRSVPRALSPGQKSEDIPFTEHEFIEKWAKKAAEEFGEDRLAIEVGSYLGCSTVILAQFFRVLAIDLWYPLEDYRDETIGDNFSNFMATWKKFKLKGRVLPILGSTTYLSEFIPGTLDVPLCFVDGDHSYFGAKRDLDFCVRCLADRGYIIVHDYPRAATVVNAVKDFCVQYNFQVTDICGDGVAVLRRRQ